MRLQQAVSDLFSDAVRDVAGNKSVFTSADVWDTFVRRGGAHAIAIEKRALGAVMQRAVKDKICTRLERVVRDPRRRQGLSQCYRSLLIAPTAAERRAEIEAEMEGLRARLTDLEEELEAL